MERRTFILFGTALAALGVVLALVRYGSEKKGAEANVTESPAIEEAAAPADAPPARDVTPAPVAPSRSVINRPAPPARPAVAPPVFEPAQVTPQSREMVSRLLQLNGSDGSLDWSAWKQNFQEIVRQGTNSLPAIREFLSRNTDLNFNDSVQQALGYASARTALFDAVTQIGGPQAVGTLSTALQTSSDPREIATLAQNLDRLEPGQHQQDALEAARQALETAVANKSSGADQAHLFEVLQKYGDASVVPDLEKAAARWNMYAAVSLAQLPDGAGVPALVRLAQAEDGADPPSRAAAVQMLGTVAAQSADARSALVDLARANRLSDYNWGTLEPVLTGSNYSYQNSVLTPGASTPAPDAQGLLHSGSNQNLFFAPPSAGIPADQIAQRTALIDDLLAATSNPTAIQMLQRSRAALTAGRQ